MAEFGPYNEDIHRKANPFYTDEHRLHLVAHFANLGTPFCLTCGDWHYEDEDCSGTALLA